MNLATKYLLMVAGLAGALWLSYTHGCNVRDAFWEAKWNKEAKTLSDKNVELLTQLREKDQLLQKQNDEVISNAEKQIGMANSAANAAELGAIGMRKQARELAAKLAACNNSPKAPISSSATPPSGMVLAELFERADKRAGELAAAYDRARAAGLACEASYDALERSIRVEPQQGIK